MISKALCLLLTTCVSGCATTSTATSDDPSRVLKLISYYEQTGPSQRPEVKLVAVEPRGQSRDRVVEHWTVEANGQKSRYEISKARSEIDRSGKIDVQKLR